ncbi:dehydrogenase [Microbacterium radiodurans]|uniref:dehydrogenase n=1 Tax=Microbacterium radiodurans TaxID=661398 RepID=UPI00168B1E57|nr:dehydrogenase [Microbacterium radiodurans]
MTTPTDDDRTPLPPADYAESQTIALAEAVADAGELPASIAALQPNPAWWAARPAGARLVGLVVSRDDMPTIVAQRDALAQFGVPIEGFRHPAPEIGESWEQRLSRLFGHLTAGDVVVVADVHALGRDADEETRTIAELRRRSIIVKVLGARAV